MWISAVSILTKFKLSRYIIVLCAKLWCQNVYKLSRLWLNNKKLKCIFWKILKIFWPIFYFLIAFNKTSIHFYICINTYSCNTKYKYSSSVNLKSNEVFYTSKTYFKKIYRCYWYFGRFMYLSITNENFCISIFCSKWSDVN